MKILFLTPNRRDLVGINRFYFLEQEIAKHADCKWAGYKHHNFKRGESTDSVVKRLYGDDSPDWVLTTPCITNYDLPFMSNLPPEKRPYKIGGFLTDIHSNMVLEKKGYRGVKGYVKALNEANLDAVLMHYIKTLCSQDGLSRRTRTINPDYFLKKLKMQICYVPPCVKTSLYKPSKKSKIYDVALLGCITRASYPLRYKIFSELPALAKRKKWHVVIRRRPKGKSLERKMKKVSKKYIVGKKYVEVLARTKVFIFSSSIYKYPLYKYFEGMACKTCVMADRPFTADFLHFIPDENFVEINHRNWKKKLIYYIEHNAEREKIARQGYETVLKYHTVGIRAKELIEFLEKYK